MYLPPFISKAITDRNTSAGENQAFGGLCVQLTQKLLEDRYKQVIDSITDKFGYVPTIDEAHTLLSKLTVMAMELERPLRNQLETLCESTVNTTLGVPQETILLSCELSDEIRPDRELRIMPEFIEEEPEYTYSDVHMSGNEDILRRRLTNILVQGVSYLLMTDTYDNENLNDWSEELPGLYAKIIALNDYLLFSKEESITDKNPMLGAYVETSIGDTDEKTVIDAQGLIYPFLLQETYRGFFEMFATHGLPDNKKDAMYIIRRADFTMAEAWDLRLGVPMWQYMDKSVPDNVDTTMYPYLFSSLVQLDNVEFNKTVFNMLTDNREAKEWAENIVNQVKHDKEYQLFKTDIANFNLEKCLVTEDNK